VGAASATAIGIPTGPDKNGIGTTHPLQVIEGAGTWRLGGGRTVIEVSEGVRLRPDRAAYSHDGSTTMALTHEETGARLTVNTDTAGEVGRALPDGATEESSRAVNAIFDQIMNSARLEPGPDPPTDPPPGRYIALSIGSAHACALTEVGEVTCWRSEHIWDDVGQAEPPPGRYTAISSAANYNCGIAATSGEIVCWGELSVFSPLHPPPGRHTAVSTSGSHVCALTEAGEAVCWGNMGYNAGPALGQPGPAGPYTAISAAFLHAKYGSGTNCALTMEGDVDCWGAYSREEGPYVGPYTHLATRAHGGFCGVTRDGAAECLGYPEMMPFAELFAATLSPSDTADGARYAAIAASETHVCALTTEGRAICGAEQTGFGALSILLPPDPAPGRYVAIEVGHWAACAITDLGAIACWEAVANRIAPPDPAPGRHVAVSDGYGHTCALTGDGEAACWGWNNYGQSEVPRGRYVAISAGAFHTCAIAESGETVCWGERFLAAEPPAGQLATISLDEFSMCALTVAGEVVCTGYSFGSPPAEPQVALSAGAGGACAIAESGELACWGQAPELPADFAGGRYTAVSVGGSEVNTHPLHVCALTTEGEVRCWGWLGQDGPFLDSPPGRFVAVAAGDWHACALTEDGEAVCWGGNDFGQTEAPEGRYTTVSASASRTCAVTTEGEVVCWGETDYAWPPHWPCCW
jgi:alpha-tubulin suppressor-like RCC1 family protein